ncbi:MAG: iron ABC transporter permease, partial [Oscillospiraceae bacterium]|nr:iron ABC transporter permease [Oscillospiraceae bacterium]
LPRTCACLLAGAALACSGCILQSVLGNKLASPNIIGVNAGAGLGVTLCCALGIASGWTVSLAAFGGAMLAVFTVVTLAKKTGASRTTVILSGVALNSILGAFRDAVTTLIPEAAMLSGEFRVGGFSAVVPARLLPSGILITAALLLALTLCNELDVLALGEETAHSLGMSVKHIRTLFLLLAALLAGTAVSFAGLLGFVGLLVPHISRKIVGGESRSLLPMSILLGAGLITLSDLAARTLFAPYELPVGILISCIGGPFFLFLLLEKKGGHRHA